MESVLATDTRVTAGGFIAHKRGKKLLQVDDHIAVTISGGVADAQNVVDTPEVLLRAATGSRRGAAPRQVGGPHSL